MTAFPTLFSPLRLPCGATLRNRIGFAALSARLARDGRVTEAMAAHMEARARGGAALVITEALSAAPSAATPVRVAAYEEAALPGLAMLAEAVARHGALAIGQLWHSGSAHRGSRLLDAVGPSAVPDGMSWTVPRVLTAGEIEALVEDYAETAHRLQRAGFAGIEISAAHGFLPLQFLSPVTNLREDAWGGDLAGRTRFLRALLAAVRARCGAGFVVGLKLPADDGVPGSIGPEEAARITAAIVASQAPPDWLCFSQGSHGWSLWMHSPDMHEPVAPWRGLLRGLREAAGPVPIAAIGRVAAPHIAEDLLAGGEADLVMLARPLFADPDWPAKAREGRAAAIRPCIHCNACWGEINRGAVIACSVNPLGGTRLDGTPATPATRQKRIVVVGAGVAGLQAAATAAERGHRVTLLGAGAAPGGKAALHARLPGCGDIARFVDHLVARATAAGVDLRLGAAADAAAVLALAPEAVVLATGAAMVAPPGLADVPDLRAAAAAALHEGAQGGLCVVFDQDHTPATYAAIELLAQRHARIVVVTPRETIAQDTPGIYAQGVHRRLARLGVEILPYRRPVGFADGTLRLLHLLTGAETMLGPVARLAYATGRRPLDALRAPLEAADIPVIAVGDAKAPRLMLSAVAEGEAAARAL